MTTRRQFCAALAAVGFAARAGRAGASEEIVVTDMAGRLVRLPARPERIVLLEAHDLLTMSLLHPDPASLTVGWAGVDRIDSARLTSGLPKGHAIEIVGKLTPETVSLERLIGLQPDLVVTTAFMSAAGAQDSLLSRLEQLGVPVVFSDASSNSAVAEADPVAKLATQMRMWSVLLDVSEKADAYIGFFKAQLDEISSRLSGAKPVTTYLEVQSTADDCCWAAGVKVWGELLALAGGQLLPGVTAPWFEKLSLEYVISTPHEVYIASGGDYSAGGRPTIAPGVDGRTAQQSLERLLAARPSFRAAPSVRKGQVHGVWTGLITNLPLNILFVAAAAKWLHPDRCADIDPSDMLNNINRDFAAVPIEGSLWASSG